jgi:hypothetical protein
MTSRISKARSGSGHAYAIDGQRVPSVTTVIDNATAKRALIGAAAKETALWAAANVDMLPVIGEADWIEKATKARFEVWGKKAAKGTDVHRYAEQLVTTGTTDAPPELVPVVESAAAFMDAWQLDEIAAERPCANLPYRYAGTFDVLGRLADGQTWLLDWKTGKGPYSDQVLQLVGYAACNVYQDTNGDDRPMPPIDALGFVMLKDDGWELVPVADSVDNLFPVFSRMIGVARYAQETTPNRAGIAKWTVLGEPLGAPVAAS